MDELESEAALVAFIAEWSGVGNATPITHPNDDDESADRFACEARIAVVLRPSLRTVAVVALPHSFACASLLHAPRPSVPPSLSASSSAASSDASSSGIAASLTAGTLVAGCRDGHVLVFHHIASIAIGHAAADSGSNSTTGSRVRHELRHVQTLRLGVSSVALSFSRPPVWAAANTAQVAASAAPLTAAAATTSTTASHAAASEAAASASEWPASSAGVAALAAECAPFEILAACDGASLAHESLADGASTAIGAGAGGGLFLLTPLPSQTAAPCDIGSDASASATSLNRALPDGDWFSAQQVHVPAPLCPFLPSTALSLCMRTMPAASKQLPHSSFTVAESLPPLLGLTATHRLFAATLDRRPRMRWRSYHVGHSGM